jgi:hypothetical protein
MSKERDLGDDDGPKGEEIPFEVRERHPSGCPHILTAETDRYHLLAHVFGGACASDDCEEAELPPERAEPGTARQGPARVNSEAYVRNYVAIFGDRTRGQA